MNHVNRYNKPNIVFILIDDMGWKDLSCYGSDFYETPNIDKLAEDGMLFTDAYAACPVCSPTRASIMSGKYPARVGVTDWIGAHTRGKLIDAPYVKYLPLEEKSLAQALKEGGYNTWHVGKWHLGTEEYYPDKHGFDVNIGGCHLGHPAKGYFSPYDIENLSDGIDGEYLTDRITNEAIRLINNNDGKPFFLNLWHYTVHTPIEAKYEDIKRFEEKAKKLGINKVKCIEEGEFFPCNYKKHLKVQRRIMQSDSVYAAMIYNLDWNIGRLMKVLEEKEQLENTVVIFTSDNGGLATAEGSPTCNAPLSEGKGWMYEGGVREPLIVRWPDVVAPGSICYEPVTSPDFYPTILKIAGLPLIPEQHMDGKSFEALLRGSDSFQRGPIFWHYPHYGNQGGTPGCAIRVGDYKLIEFSEDNRLELYNLREDISEEKNLADKLPELALEMHERLIVWRNSIEAKIPAPNPEYCPLR
ncbi:sulfatase [Clostridium swellfunianum]|uniref:sulfatase n=1 Tax=Clostridium swellfunianum TaxID=1367462 RepID=UPI00202EDA0F|nr:sulfatase [Clostridium swellfunianum]MCM0646860.1 sulfatase [Clostridium swellfunianum]